MNKIIGVIVLLMCSTVLGQENMPDQRLVDGRYVTKGFSILLPYPPKEFRDHGDTIIVSTNKEDTVSYMVSVFPVEPNELKVKTASQILDETVRGAVLNADAELLSSSIITIKMCYKSTCIKYPGRQFDVKSITSNVLIAKCRMYLVMSKIYLIMVIYDPKNVLPLSADDFHNSFVITPSIN